ncbi:hypothetical protein LG307_19340 [Sutcliffiella horikoshii]|uniref:hypothetical protein n=1 Tax=Sutcliffiella horikoshii TaxID=79883 RepID=UPI0007BEC76F
MKRIQKQSELLKLKETYEKVILTSDPFINPFKETVEKKLIIFPTDGYYLNKEQFYALKYAIESVGEEGFFISESEGDSFTISSVQDVEFPSQHWKVEESLNFSEYQSIPLVLENTLYSLRGRWGVQISHEDHAIVGGSALFIKKFQESYPNWEHDKERFLEYWSQNNQRYNSDIQWLEELLKNV